MMAVGGGGGIRLDMRWRRRRRRVAAERSRETFCSNHMIG